RLHDGALDDVAEAEGGFASAGIDHLQGIEINEVVAVVDAEFAAEVAEMAVGLTRTMQAFRVKDAGFLGVPHHVDGGEAGVDVKLHARNRRFVHRQYVEQAPDVGAIVKTDVGVRIDGDHRTVADPAAELDRGEPRRLLANEIEASGIEPDMTQRAIHTPRQPGDAGRTAAADLPADGMAWGERKGRIIDQYPGAGKVGELPRQFLEGPVGTGPVPPGQHHEQALSTFEVGHGKAEWQIVDAGLVAALLEPEGQI